MNLKKVITASTRISDSCLLEFISDIGVSADTLLKEVNQYLSSDTKRQFISDFIDAWDLPESEEKYSCLEQFRSDYSLTADEIIAELNQWLSEKDRSEMIESIKESWDI